MFYDEKNIQAIGTAFQKQRKEEEKDGPKAEVCKFSKGTFCDNILTS